VSAYVARAIVEELASLAQVVRHEGSPSDVGPIAVSGVLAEQLGREIGAGARPGSVLVTASVPPRAEVLVRIVAGDPTADDEAVVREADLLGIAVIIVQLWPQAEWTRPYVLTPFVVECRAGEGFPIGEIGDRIVDASDRDAGLAARIPVLRPSVRKNIVRRTVFRTAVLGVLPSGNARPLMTLDQVRMVSRLRSVGGRTEDGASAAIVSLGGASGLVLASGLALRLVARATRLVLPAPLADGIVAGAGTWAIGKAVQALDARRPS